MSAKYIQIERIRRTAAIANNMQQVVADIHVGDESDLPALNEQIGGMIFMPTSFAVTKTGVWYKLYADGKWYKQDGSGDTSETPASVSASVNSTRTLDAPTLTKTLEIEQPEIKSEEIADEPETEPEVTEDER